MRGTHLDETKITYHGRNRMGAKPKRNSTTTKPGKYMPSASLTAKDYWTRSVPAGENRIIYGRTTSEIVQRLAERMGFWDKMQLIEDTSDRDTIESGMMVLGPDQAEGEWIGMAAEQLGFIFRIDHKGLHFHHKNWSGANKRVVHHTFRLGGPDIIEGPAIDGDFALPLPSELKAVGYNPLNKTMTVRSATGAAVSDAAFSLLDRLPKKQRDRLTRAYTIPVTRVGETASAKAQAAFHQRHLSSFKINTVIVGNPAVMAGQNIEIVGTNTSLVDNIWFCAEAKHIFDGMTYKTSLVLRQPRKRPKPMGGNRSDLTQSNTPATLSAARRYINDPAGPFGPRSSPALKQTRNDPPPPWPWALPSTPVNGKATNAYYKSWTSGAKSSSKRSK